MAKIRADETHLECRIKIKRGWFDALLIMCAIWLHLDSPSEIQRPRLNRNDSHSYVSLEPLSEN